MDLEVSLRRHNMTLFVPPYRTQFGYFKFEVLYAKKYFVEYCHAASLYVVP